MSSLKLNATKQKQISSNDKKYFLGDIVLHQAHIDDMSSTRAEFKSIEITFYARDSSIWNIYKWHMLALLQHPTKRAQLFHALG